MIATWEITVSDSASRESTFTLQEGSLLLGASFDCAIVSAAAGVAPKHAEFLVNAGVLQLRILDIAPAVRLNGTSIHGLHDVACPATILIGALKVSIKQASAAIPARPDSDLSRRIEPPRRSHAPKLTDSDKLDVTGRIIYRMTDPKDSAAHLEVTQSPGSQNPLASASSSIESTLAFSMESPEIAIANKVPVRTDYAVKDEIARGGMGKIYSAEDSELDRLVALKVSTAGDRSDDAKFLCEAKILAALEHPNIVPIHNLGVDSDGRPFYSMKLIQGRTLQWIIKQLAAGEQTTVAVYSRERLLEIFRKVCDAVSFAHSKGYLHRDLKPENVMVGEFGEVLVMDWGLAKMIFKPIPGSGPEATGATEPDTLPYIEGTPQYMSPEQANGVYGGLDERSDIYSLGGILYAILTYRPPVSGSSLSEVLQKVRSGETTTMVMPRRSRGVVGPLHLKQAVPETLRAITRKALSLETTDRYQNVSAFAADIEAYQNGFATSAETAGVWRHLVLLVKRHRIASGFAAALLVAAFVFTLRLAASEKRANDNARRAQREASIAASNAKRASEQSAIASANEERALINERKAIEEKALARKSAARAQIALAEAAEQNLDASAIQNALAAVDEDLRDQAWRYLARASNSADWTSHFKSSDYYTRIPIPEKSGVLLVFLKNGAIQTLDLTSGLAEEVCQIQDAGKMAFTHGLGLSSDAKTAAVTTLEQNKGNSDAFTFQVHLINLEDGTRKPLEATSLSSQFREFHLGFSPDGKLLLVLFGGRTPGHNSEAIMFDVARGTVLWMKSEKWFDLYTFQQTGKCRCFKTTGQHADLHPRTGSENEVADKPTKIPLLEANLISDPNSKGAQFFYKGTIRSLDRNDSRILYENRLQIPQIRSNNLSYLDEGRLVASLSEVSESSAILQIWNESGGQLLRSIPTAFRYHVKLITHPKWQHVAVLDGPTSKVWSIRSVQEEILPMDNHISHGFAFFGPPGSVIFQQPRTTAKMVARAILFNQRENERSDTKLLEQIPNPVSFFSASRNAHILAFGVVPSVYAPASLRLFRNENLTQLQELCNVSISGIPYSFELNAEGSVLWLGNGFYDSYTGNLITQLDRTGLKTLDKGGSACWVGNANVAELVAKATQTSDWSRAIVLWSFENGSRTEEPAPGALSLSASPDGAHIAEASSDMRVRIRNAATLKEEKTLRVHDAPVTGVAWHPSMPLLATASQDYTVKIWNLETDSLVEEIALFLGTPGKLYWSPDGKTLAVRTTNGRDGINLFTPKACNPPER